MKQCRGKCGRVLPLSEFYKVAHSVDGHKHTCKQCLADWQSSDRQVNPEKYAAYERERSKRPERIAYDKARRTQPQRMELQRKAQRRYYQRHPDRQQARTKLTDAVRYGKIHRMPCFYCDDPKTEAHHFDYTRPFDIIWLCTYHHRELDGRPTGQSKAA